MRDSARPRGELGTAEPQAAKVAGGIALSTLVIAGFVIAWPEIEDLFAENLSTWFYGY